MRHAHRRSSPTAGRQFVRLVASWWVAFGLVACTNDPSRQPGPVKVPPAGASLTATAPAEGWRACARLGQFRLGATVIERGSITTRLIDPSRRTVVVLADTMLPGAPSAVRSLDGRRITLILADTTDTVGVAPGVRSLYVASGVLFDTSVVLRTHCSVPLIVPGTDSAISVTAFTGVLAAADSLNARASLSARAQEATVVVAVRVLSVDSSLHYSYPGEHNPRWRTALTNVLYRKKPADGVPNVGDTLRFFFPGARGFRYESLYLTAGDEAVVLLHRLSELHPTLRRGLDSTNTLVLLNRLDRRPAGDSLLVKTP